MGETKWGYCSVRKFCTSAKIRTGAKILTGAKFRTGANDFVMLVIFTCLVL